MAPKVRSCLSMISACFFDVPVRYFVGTSKNTWKYRAYHGFSCALVHSGQICWGLKRCFPRLFFMCFGFAPDPQDPRPVNFADFHRRGAAGLPAAFPQ